MKCVFLFILVQFKKSSLAFIVEQSLNYKLMYNENVLYVLSLRTLYKSFILCTARAVGRDWPQCACNQPAETEV